MIVEKHTERKCKEEVVACFKALFRNFTSGTEKNNNLRIESARVDIRTLHLPNTRQNNYRLINLLVYIYIYIYILIYVLGY
jgi:hypothetical protein